ncbi:MAG: bifunctional (p)ppGpp synthetase/guanosine-3',5'-bis(diphosphate) 3'-pyrophosphohydrolase [Armatimonadetes bacterium]|nr:bifunctional (p)ppGpp synthetase/guanosine-3',5'-bis(diphosphate) 3'-pyrophosphohydrolase [Armatimonadota bacterium]
MALQTTEEIAASFDELLQRLLGYRPEADVELLRRSFEFAVKVHDGQLRQSGEPYVTHPLAACHILCDIEADETALAACMLHDTVEDCAQDEERAIKALRRELDELRGQGKRREADELAAEVAARESVVEKLKDAVESELRDEFGPVIAGLVDGVTRLSEVRFSELSGQHPLECELQADASEKERLRRRLQAENRRRMVVAAAKDVRVLVIKLADRLHNMQTLYAKRRAKQLKIARESEVIYAKLAERLGIWRFKWEMEDLAFQYLHPEAYFDIERRVARTREERMADIEAVVNRIIAALAAEGVPAEVTGRPKHLYSIWCKMQRQGIDFDAIYDLEGIRIITDKVWQCYQVLYIVHNVWPHQPEHFADFISNPKSNGYQSIHTKVIVAAHGPMEIQIRTAEMHRNAEHGVAAHWRYKDEGVIDEGFAARLTNLRRIFEMARESAPDEAIAPARDDEGDFEEEVTANLWEDDIFVFTPRNEVIDLPAGATVVDFAYRIHTELGHTCVGARVNRRMVPLSHQLKNGDHVEVVVQRNTGPSRDWLNFVATSTARNRIKQYFRRKERETLIERGQQAIEAEAVRQRLDLNELYRQDTELPAQYRRRGQEFPVEDVLTRVACRRGYRTDDDLLTAVGDGVISAEGVVQQICNDLQQAREAAGLAAETVPPGLAGGDVVHQAEAAVSLQGARNLMFKRSKCCLPIPGDQIVGYITRGSGIAIHRADCPNVRHLQEKEPDRVVQLDWDQAQHMLYDVPLEIRATDRLGLLRDVTGLITDLGINILGVNTTSPRLHSASSDHVAVMNVHLELVDRHQLEQLTRRLPELGALKITIRGQVFHDTEKGSRRRAGGAKATRPKRRVGRP